MRSSVWSLIGLALVAALVVACAPPATLLTAPTTVAADRFTEIHDLLIEAGVMQ